MYENQTFILSKNQKQKIIIVIAIIIVILSLLIIPKIFNNNPEKEFKETMEKIGKDFYSNYYYNQVLHNYKEDKAQEFLKRYEENGLKIDLENLNLYESQEYDIQKELSYFLNSKKQKCDYKNSYLTIYPKSPYKKEDIKIEVTVNCALSN